MLGLGFHRYRKQGQNEPNRFAEHMTEAPGTYHSSNNPVGLYGHHYFGNFNLATDADDFTTVDASKTVSSGRLRVRASDVNGHVYISVAVLPGRLYDFACLFDPTSQGNDNGWMKIGTAANDGTYGSQIYNSQNTLFKKQFTMGAVSTCVLSLGLNGNTRTVYFDNISLKLA